MDYDVPPRRKRRWWCGVAAAMMIAPAVMAPPSAYLPAVMAALSLTVSILALPSGRISLARAAGGVAVLSLAADVGYFGQPGLVILWFPFETAALLVLLERVVRHVPSPRVGIVGPLTGAAAILLPLRFTLHAPGSGLKESVFASSLALVAAACAVGVGLYLRSLDNRRAQAVAQARREHRLEVARDLHDFVAHEVTGIVLEAQAAQIGEGTDAEEHRALLQRIEKAGLRALDSMDQTVTALREAEGRKWRGAAAHPAPQPGGSIPNSSAVSRPWAPPRWHSPRRRWTASFRGKPETPHAAWCWNR
ncbi:histidine kinase [Streptomyces celluloflavus]|uniref:histidine kinase n=1 Tax=Streptomyces celluloflavus TaxID=58344 RepID=UPI0036DD4DD7